MAGINNLLFTQDQIGSVWSTDLLPTFGAIPVDRE